MNPSVNTKKVEGFGLGFRFGLADQMLGAERSAADFVEIAPENYIGVGGRRARLIDAVRERWPIVSHGLCGDFAGGMPFDLDYMRDLRTFLKRIGAQWYSDHLCFTNLRGAEMHELVALPFTDEAVKRAAARIRDVQDFLGMPVAVENVSAYGEMPGAEMTEADFVAEVVRESGGHLLLDVNNVYVNSVNFKFDPRAYIDRLPLDRVLEVHVAGYFQEAPDLLLDTHAMPISDPVYDLFAYAMAKLPHRPPVLLERDGNFPPLAELESELARLDNIAEKVHAAA
ncbi:MAG: DUF692 domain-containing protein [Deltaproteobacteria bacterium]|nr:DUF692 domain-containing protein [Deltaproteobacteria bacterium]